LTGLFTTHNIIVRVTSAACVCIRLRLWIWLYDWWFRLIVLNIRLRRIRLIDRRLILIIWIIIWRRLRYWLEIRWR
jgi:hypothetical protein